MDKNFTREQFWQKFNQLPKTTQDLILSEEMAKSIFDVCNGNDIDDVLKIPEVGRYTSRVLLGVLPKDEFAATLEKEVGLEKDIAQKIAQGIEEAIFNKAEGTPTEETSSAPSPLPEEPERRQGPRGPDTYRESVEKE